MESKDIIKALECCIKSSHLGECFENKCPLVSEKGCKVGKETLYSYALELIKNQQAEIEKLKAENAIILKQAFAENITTAIAIKAEFEQQRRTVEYIKRLEAEIERLQNSYKQCACERDVFEKQLETEEELTERKEDYKIKERKFTIEVTINERWVDAFCSFLKHLETNGKVGHSEYVTIFADGDGDFRSEFNINTEFDKTKSFDYKGEIHTSIYDAG